MMYNLLKYVSSFTEGRIRIRHHALTHDSTIRTVRNRIASVPGIRQLDFNPRTGSLLLLYDPQILSREKLLKIGIDLVSEMEGAMPLTGEKRLGEFFRALPDSRQILNRGMLATLVLTVFSGISGSKLSHIASGTLLATLALAHSFKHRKRL